MAKMSIATANLSTSHNQPPSQHPSQGSNSLTRTLESEPRPGRNKRVQSFSPIQIKLSSERVSTECHSNRKRAGKSTKALTRANTSPRNPTQSSSLRNMTHQSSMPQLPPGMHPLATQNHLYLLPPLEPCSHNQPWFMYDYQDPTLGGNSVGEIYQYVRQPPWHVGVT